MAEESRLKSLRKRFRRFPQQPVSQKVQEPQPRPSQPLPQEQKPVQPVPQQPKPAPQQPQPQKQPAPQAPAFQKPRTPAPPVAPKAPPGKIEMEKKLMKISKARREQFWKYVIGFIIIIAGGYVYLFRPAELSMISSIISPDYVAAALAFIGIVIILYAEGRERGANYYITQYRIVEVFGLLRKREHGLQLSQIESVKTHQSLFNRILGIGDVEIKTSRDSLILKKVGNPGKVEAMLLSEINRKRSTPSQPG